ncbi:MAG: hypothetical protein GY700_04195, partial [Propionibacteriaceae bacterium]|nr:hypothetical protein [Propionibacteriaceae bacterium]
SHLKPLSGTGPSDYRKEYLKALTRRFSDPTANGAIEAHEALACLYINGKMPAWYYFAIGAVEMIALIKKVLTSGP